MDPRMAKVVILAWDPDMGLGPSPGSYLRVLPSFRLDLLTDELRDPSDAREGPDPSDPG